MLKMSSSYQERIKYITEDLMLENFNLYTPLNKVKAILQDEKHTHYWENLYKLRVKFYIKTPDYGLLTQFYNQGLFKSHEFAAIIDMVTAKVKSSISILTNTLDYTITQYIPLKNAITIQRSEAFEKVKGNRSVQIDNVELTFNLKWLSIKDVFAFLRWWNLDDFCFSKQIRIEVEGKLNGDSEYTAIVQFNLKKRSISLVKNFLSHKDLEKTNKLLRHKHYFHLLKNFMFPEGFDNKAEITLDIVKDELMPQKRRTVLIDGTSMKFHQLITEFTPLEQYQRIIKENRIVGLYCSVKSASDDLLYLLIDIDVPSLFYHLFNPQDVWDLTINIAKSISKTASRFGLPSFKVSFSGAKGLHMVMAFENPRVIQDVEQYVNLPELYSSSLLPGIKTLKKEKVSSLNDKFKFAKSLLQSLLLYTVYKEEIDIPVEIRRKFRILYPYKLFRLSYDSKNKLAILLDCSSMSRGVFRLYSPHPSSKLVSIPISDMRTGKICEKYHEYKNVKEDASLENVIQKFNDNDVKLLLQRPNKITRKQIRNLLRPDRLLPVFAILLRFGTIYSIMRSPNSFDFWCRFYELKCFYGYVQDCMEYDTYEDTDTFMAFIHNMTTRLDIKNKEQIIELLQNYCVNKRINFPLFKYWFTTLYFIEFFFNLKSEIFLRKNKENMIELIHNEFEFRNYLCQTQEIVSIAGYTLAKHVILGNKPHLSKKQVDSIKVFYKGLSSLIDLARYYLINLTHSLDFDDMEKYLIRTIHIVSKLYVLSIIFIRDFYNITEESR
jgi:hypothetical protein